MTFYVGQKVVCVVDASGWVGDTNGRPAAEMFDVPEKDGVYTVRGYEFNDGRQFLCFEEIINPVCNFDVGGRGEPVFSAANFRPVVDRKTDISVFTALLNPQHQKHLITSDT
jgi:hypothetical protein